MHLNPSHTHLETFAREAREVVFATRALRYVSSWPQLSAGYLCHCALAADSDVFYAMRTVRQTTDWIAAQLTITDWQDRHDICYRLSHLATCRHRAIVHTTLSGSSLRFSMTEKTQGLRQSSDAAVHRLSATAYLGNMALVQTLLDLGADVNGKSDVLGRPLTAAAYGGHLSIVQLLVEKGADVSGGELQWKAKEEIYDDNLMMFTRCSNQMRSALEAAAAAGHEPIVELLLQPSLGISRSSFTFFAAMVQAAQCGHQNMLRTLFNRANFSAVVEDLKARILDAAVKRSASKGRVETLKFLLDAGAPVDLDLSAKNEPGPLWHAASNGQNSAVEVLLARGADIDERSMRPPSSPLVAAAEEGFPRTVALLLDRGAEVNDSKGMRALRYVNTSAPWCVWKVLLEKGIHKRDEEAAVDVLEIAYEDNRQDLVDLLLEYGVTLGDTAE
ncbi:ankyrin repeat-containing domain protein [Aspergillus germanicus]